MNSSDVHEMSGNRRRGALWAAIALLVVIMAGAALAFGDDSDDGDAAGSAEPTTDAGSAGDDDAPTDWCAEFPDASEDFPSDPPDVDWDEFESVSYPVSDTSGPAADQPACFAPTPTGATLAAASGVAHIATPSTGRDAYLNAILVGPGAGSVINEEPNMGDVQRARIAGYRIAPRRCSEDRCRLEVLMQIEADDVEVMMHSPIDVRQRGGTWKVHVSAGGFPDGSITDEASARSDGFVLW